MVDLFSFIYVIGVPISFVILYYMKADEEAQIIGSFGWFVIWPIILICAVIYTMKGQSHE